MYKIISLFILLVALFACNTNTNQPNQPNDVVVTTMPKELADINARIDKDPINSALFYERAKYYQNIRDLNAALRDMQYAIQYDSTQAPYYLTISDLYLQLNQTGKTKTSLEKCLTVDVNNTDAMLKLAELYFYVKKYEESIRYINDALKVNQYISKAYFLKGMNYKEIGDTTKAVSSMITATEQDPDYYAAYLELGVLHAIKKNKIAISYYDNALRINSRSTDALYNKGKFYQDIKEWDNATRIYTELLAVDPKYKYAHYNLGAIALSKKDYDNSLRFFTNAINSDPNYAQAFYARGTAYFQKGDRLHAKVDYQMAIQVDPKFQAAYDALAEIAK